MLTSDTKTRADAELAESLATWVEQLRDMLHGAAGLHQAVSATVPVAPERIREEVRELDGRLRAGQPMEQAASIFARVDSNIGDLVGITLITGASRQAGDLAGMLGRLAEAARDRATTVERISASRATTSTSVRIIAAATTLMLVAMVAFNPAFLTPLGTPTGQLVLGLVGALWAAAFFWLSRLASPPRQARPFSLAQAATVGAGGAS
ncbi:type II secretion system F family protein [Nocardiopsis salina]|uniref:type II secretion system F family protein n=1 Tax=Nocardiopsis salina TaxID=245836 RepID=UPI001EF9E06E|nr:type II secretion system F family protein [Nocardiopsis salina]